uniref:Uncharacterized protein n=1 Tax=Arundo donax TaxID=35708 RepID=A0A0A9BJ06_ARUDO
MGAQQHRVAGSVVALLGAPPEATGRVQPSHVRDGRREDGEHHQDLEVVPFLLELGGRRRLSSSKEPKVMIEEDDGHVGEYAGHQHDGANGGERVVAAPDGVGPHGAEEVDHHHRPNEEEYRLALAIAVIPVYEEEEANKERCGK